MTPTEGPDAGAGSGPGEDLGRGDAKVFLEQWKTIIDVQKHFNEIILRMRTTGVSVAIAVYGAAALSVSQFPDKYLIVVCYRVHPSAVILLFGLLLLTSIFAMDYWYYYRLPLASVEMGSQLDRQVAGRAFSGIRLLGLTTLISAQVTPRRARTALFVFYGVPFGVGLLALLYVLFAYHGVASLK
jgi:hypothetical protein